jgi:hypothetical protein
MAEVLVLERSGFRQGLTGAKNTGKGSHRAVLGEASKLRDFEA